MHDRIAMLAAACCVLAACAPDAVRERAPAAPHPEAIAIGSVQGRGNASPRAGEIVVVEGTVVGLLGGAMGGWFVQDGGDGDPATSDALFVETQNREAKPQRRVRIRGRVVERDVGGHATLTTLEPLQIETLGRGPPLAPTPVSAAPAQAADWERCEGMLLRIDAPLTVTATRQLSGFGILSASFDGRPFTPTEIAAPGAEAQRIAADNARRRFALDDGQLVRDPYRIGYLPPQRGTPRAGSVVERAIGVLDQRGGYSLQLTEPLQIRAAARPPAPKVDGNVRIASLNLENLFNGDGRGGGFPTKRGAKTAQQYAVQLSKLVATLRALDPDIAALMELENDGYGPESSLAQLVAAMNEGGGDWRHVETARGPGSDDIRVGLIYRGKRVETVGRPATLTAGPFADRSRAPLAQAFRAGRGPVFVVAANHFKSKGCTEASGADADQRDGQSCWNATRVESATGLDRWLKTDPTRSSSPLVMIVGDLNAYAEEDPLRRLRSRGWQDAFAIARRHGAPSADAPGERPYSYVYDGQSGRLDHALLSPALAKRLGGVAEWHINADEAGNVGYREDISAENTATPWRSSDHDPLLTGFDLRR
ncbi:ExeM/NucH family extracellular endonuclease [Luteimonas sp. SX5]|uniref:ExeM/NucH family extracellular endonuclease n=1 Tax=Luteimonas galliterrae TaxID=2940486 RepID=A0ABT0MMI5_9GAMM|nr:ExeM/NucH family extracellular endonuclease [Luteimonas galliterrae]MCL1636089.1 ExeM/NucH family extracellular endonuclease [Luteimonas galliterrae]